MTVPVLMRSLSSTPRLDSGCWWTGWSRPDMHTLCQSLALYQDFVFEINLINITDKYFETFHIWNRKIKVSEPGRYGIVIEKCWELFSLFSFMYNYNSGFYKVMWAAKSERTLFLSVQTSEWVFLFFFTPSSNSRQVTTKSSKSYIYRRNV